MDEDRSDAGLPKWIHFSHGHAQFLYFRHLHERFKKAKQKIESVG
jgi:hypothetical protein